MLDQITKADFAAHLNTEFTLHRDGQEPLVLQLAEVADCGGSKSPGRRDPFSVFFLGSDDVVLPQMMYRLSHDGLGELELFLVPIGPDPAGRGLQYEAVFT
jgi:hypothetical protein